MQEADTNNEVGAESPESGLTEITVAELPDPQQEAVKRAGWSELMPVQAKGIPYLLAGHDMMVQARTGSGKTGAFLLPMLDRLDLTRDRTQALVLVPTRELAKQVCADAETLFGADGLRTAAVYGGVGYGPQLDALRSGVHIVVGTPGRILDHLMRRSFDLNDLKMLIFDEADRMMSMGFYPDMRKLQGFLPRSPLHVCMFSATFPAFVMGVADEFMTAPKFLSLSRDHVHVTDTEHVYYTADAMDKDRALVRIIEMENPSSALIFCNRKSKVHYVSVVLQRFGYDADELSSDLSQKQREIILERVKEGKLRFLVATDVAARGIDIPDLSHVVLFEPPEDQESYIHRAGRTGRAGATGVAISLVTEIEKFQISDISKAYDIEFEERPLPSDEDVAKLVAQRLIAHLEARLRDRDKLQAERARRFIPLAKELMENEEESALVAMLLDDYYQQLLHAPVEKPGERTELRRDPREHRPRKGGRRDGGRRGRGKRRR